jgi:hypothetical protein
MESALARPTIVQTPQTIASRLAVVSAAGKAHR